MSGDPTTYKENYVLYDINAFNLNLTEQNQSVISHCCSKAPYSYRGRVLTLVHYELTNYFPETNYRQHVSMITTRTDSFTALWNALTHKDIHPDFKQTFVQVQILIPSNNQTRNRYLGDLPHHYTRRCFSFSHIVASFNSTVKLGNSTEVGCCKIAPQGINHLFENNRVTAAWRLWIVLGN